MCDDLSSLIPSDGGTKPTAVWEKSLPKNEFFSILLDEVYKRLGHKILNKTRDFHCYFDEDDVINESMRKLLRRLRRPINGVAELSADGSTIYFNDFKRVFGYLKKKFIERAIMDMIRKRTKDKENHHGDNDTLNEIVVPAPKVVREIKRQAPDRWIAAIKDDLDISHQRILLLRLDGHPDREIASRLGISHMKARRCRNEVISCFKQKFSSPKDLLENDVS
jgi:DNA-directed RNA polymerase specialized sigma24 family protein